MAHWLLKTEPDCYSWGDFQRDKKTRWDGVTNALALKHMRAMKPGDLALIYHTADERAAVGIAEVRSEAYADPAAENAKQVVIDLAIQRSLKSPVTLAQIKADPAFAGWELIRISRLGVMPVPPAMWARILKLSEAPK